MFKRMDEMEDEIMAKAYPIEEKAPSASTAFYASEAGGGIRKIWFRRMQEPYTNMLNNRNHMVFGIGEAIHGMIEDIYKKSGKWLATEFRLYDPDTRVSARVDTVIEEDGIPIPVEFKSISHYGWKYIQNEPKEEHVAQIMIYMKAMGAPYGYLHYIDKNSQEQLIWRVDYNSEIYMKLVEKFHAVEDAIATGEMPPLCKGCDKPDKFPASWGWGSCSWKDKCWP